MIDQTIAHYKIVEKLGEGGMGVVYRAEDQKLRRSVALKFLTGRALEDEEQRARFLREAQAAAGLDHSNICTVYEVGEDAGSTFIAMAYLEGQSLQEKIAAAPLDFEEVVAIATQIGRGLRAAHSNGVVHRDIKPANIIVKKDGEAKIVDFGLAQLGGDRALTGVGSAVGTTAYMSPEQAMADPLDHRTDIWSLGALLYEMITGRPPFRGLYGDAIVYSIVNEEPQPMNELREELPDSLQRIVSKALQKDPDERYSDVDALLGDLESYDQRAESRGDQSRVDETPPAPVEAAKPNRTLAVAVIGTALALVAATLLFLGGGRENSSRSIAVLPLDNFSDDPEQDYFVDGMHEALIAELAQIKALTVISRTSANQYRGTEKSLPEIAAELDVDVVLEGSVLRADDSVRITVQLIGTEPERHLWAQSYTGNLTSILLLQSQVAQAVAKEIEVAVSPDEATRLASSREVDPIVYQHYLRGRRLCGAQSESELYRGVDQFRQAIEIDPSYAPAHAGLAACYSTLAMWFIPFEEGAARVKAAVEEALRLDDELAEAYARRGYAKLIFERDLSGEADFQRALKLDPNGVKVLLTYGWYLTTSGRFDEADLMFKRALELDPVGRLTALDAGWASFVARRYDQSIRQLTRALELGPEFPYADAWMAASYVQKGMHREAAVSAERADLQSASSEDQNLLAVLGWVYGSLDREDDARRIIDRINGLGTHRVIDPARLAAVHLALGEYDQAFALMEQGASTSIVSALFPVHPFIDPLRADPRFHELLRELGLQP